MTIKLTTRPTRRDWQEGGGSLAWHDRWAEALKGHVDFVAGNLWSATMHDYNISCGRLNGDERVILARHILRLGTAYVIHSYATPIAWWTEREGWYLVKERFSVTTSKHQSLIAIAVARATETKVNVAHVIEHWPVKAVGAQAQDGQS